MSLEEIQKRWKNISPAVACASCLYTALRMNEKCGEDCPREEEQFHFYSGDPVEYASSDIHFLLAVIEALMEENRTLYPITP